VSTFKLAPYASSFTASRGRLHAESEPAYRSVDQRDGFQRDRDRIVHSNAFRRLEYKTQVFINHEGDLFRTRLTHSLEVAQIGRSIARSLQLNEDLVEAISLAHDLGHTPFGHAGQDALHHAMKGHGGFEHNLQSLRVVDELELRYAEFDGLNLCFETREGILKHCSVSRAQKLGEVGQRFLDKTRPSLEAQVCNLADEIAYNNHDIDDGLRSGLITIDQLKETDLFAAHWNEVLRKHKGLNAKRAVPETIRRMISTLVLDLVICTKNKLHEAKIDSPQAARKALAAVAFTDATASASQQLKRFLKAQLYSHPAVNEKMNHAKAVVAMLFDLYMANPRLMPDDHALIFEQRGPRAVSDYIAGMTDRFALREHARLTKVDYEAQTSIQAVVNLR
jgi:dGTPase